MYDGTTWSDLSVTASSMKVSTVIADTYAYIDGSGDVQYVASGAAAAAIDSGSLGAITPVELGYDGLFNLIILGSGDEILTFDLTDPVSNTWTTITHTETNIAKIAIGSNLDIFILKDDGTPLYSSDSGSTWLDTYQYYNFNNYDKVELKGSEKLVDLQTDLILNLMFTIENGDKYDPAVLAPYSAEIKKIQGPGQVGQSTLVTNLALIDGSEILQGSLKFVQTLLDN